ncbi:MAG: hypothetical protein B6229_08875 [Spirochaetaceae bacterium 4572_7]|nr:MAG: hypothetical protein B6229_08875 [Spirochaetaceae bacterium 4572_7]
MKLADFMFTVGYNGGEAIVNRQTEQSGSNFSGKELVEKGLYKPALCKFLFENDKEGIQYLIDKYNHVSGSHYRTEIQMMRLFGVFTVPDKITKVKRL